MTNLETTAHNMLGDMIYDMTSFDIEALREKASDAAHEAADNAVIYYHHAHEIIGEYETHPAARGAEDDADSGETFAPSDYQKAMTVYAYYIARAVIESEASDLLDAAEERADALVDVLCRLVPGSDPILPSELRLSRDCPHGWAAHDKEEDAGGTSILFWTSGQLDGGNALAIDAGPFWLSYAWGG